MVNTVSGLKFGDAQRSLENSVKYIQIEFRINLKWNVCYSPSLENTSTSQRLRLPSTPTSWMATYCPTSGRAHVNAFVIPSSNWPGNHAQSGFRWRSVLLLPTRISRSCSGLCPQQPRVVILTTRTVCGARRSTRHHGEASFWVSEHSWPSGFWFPGLPSFE